MTHISDLPEPLGFPRCRECAYRIVGTAAVCAACATKTIKPIADAHCLTCSQSLSEPNALCGNVICGWPLDLRAFSRVDAVALHTDHLRTSLAALKYNGKTGWALIFGRLIVGWLEQHADEVADISVIIANPSAPGRQPVQHTETIMKAARAEDPLARWPLSDPDDPSHPVLVKIRPTARSAGYGWQAKMTAAREHADALELRGDVKGKRILLIDDVFTTGAQFHTVARYLKNNCGAEEVRGLVLARAPFRPPSDT